MDLNILAEMEEWAAVGFYEALKEPWPASYGRAYRCMYENMPIRIPADRYLIPFEPMANSLDRDSHECWSAESMILDMNHNSGLRVNMRLADIKKERFPQYAAFIDELVEDLQLRLKYFGGYTHTNPDIRRVVDEGFLSMKAELDQELEAVRVEGDNANQQELNLLLALKDYTEGVKAFHRHTVEALNEAVQLAEGERKRKLGMIAEAFANGFMTPASTFLEGLLAVNFTWMLDGCDSIGRVDQALGKLFEADLERNRLDLPFVRELLDEWWHSFERLNGWNLQIGGYTPEGKDGCNKLTEEIIATTERNQILRPNVAFRVTVDTPDELLIAALKSIREGSGRPALYNDDLYVNTLYGMDLGLTEEDAREIGFGGCTETMIAGMSNVGSLEGTICLASALQLALYDGYNPVRKRQEGPHSGHFEDFESFEDFLAAVKRQIQYATDGFVYRDHEQLRNRFNQGDPKLYRTFFTRDCVKNRKSFEAGGARYNWAVVSYHGIANLIDSLNAIKKFVYHENLIGKQELMEALKADFKGYEKVRSMLQSAPKYGNDDPEADGMAREVIEYTWQELYQHETPRGGRYLASVILFTTYYGAGLQVAATPDGRKAFDVLTDSVGAAQGRDLNGPTSLLKSVASLPLYLAVGSPVLNLRFQKKMLKTDDELRKLAALIRSFFKQGGLQVQIAVISTEDMKAAQAEPEKYKNLIVRIGGYSEYFNRLDKELQDSVIARTEHGL